MNETYCAILNQPVVLIDLIDMQVQHHNMRLKYGDPLFNNQAYLEYAFTK